MIVIETEEANIILTKDAFLGNVLSTSATRMKLGKRFWFFKPQLENKFQLLIYIIIGLNLTFLLVFT